MEELLPGRCDVCNGTPRLLLRTLKIFDYETGQWHKAKDKYRGIQCTNCPRPIKWFKSEPQAIAVWNRCTPIPTQKDDK